MASHSDPCEDQMFLAAMNVITKMEKFNVGLIHVNIFVIALLHWGGCRLSITCAHVFQANETDTICFNLHYFTSGQQLINLLLFQY